MRLSRRPEKKLVKKTRIYGIAMQTAPFAVCGSSFGSLSQTRGLTPLLEICDFC
jgi:hypothetical protein